MMWDLPLSVNIDGTQYSIRNKCDYRVVLDVICALQDDELSMEERFHCALLIFYEDDIKVEHLQEALNQMMSIISAGENSEEDGRTQPQLMDWEHDFKQLAPPISRVLGYSVRDANHYTHWYDFIGAYMEIGECTFSNIISIRSKRAKGKKLESWEREFYNNNKHLIDLPRKLTAEEQEWLDSDW